MTTPFYRWMQEALGIQELKRKFGDDIYPYEPLITTNGVLPWGSTDNGHRLLWLTNGTPNEWTVLINEARSDKFHAFPYSMTDFLYAWLSGTIRCDVLPYEEIDHEFLFELL